MREHVRSHTVKSTTYKLPESAGMMGTVQQAAQVANALGAVSPQFKAAKSYTHYGSFGIATGYMGYMAGAAMSTQSIRPMLKPTNWGIVGGLIVLSFLTKSKGGQE
jgi:hypothetical protein